MEGRGLQSEGPIEGPIEVWRGSVNAWECDEMGHMNVRFHLARAMQGLATAAAALGMHNAFSPSAPATLAVREHHVRYLREARVGAPLHMTAGVLDIDESEATLLLSLIHSPTGEAASTFVTRVAHISATEGRRFPWPGRAVEAARRLQTALTAESGPRSITAAAPGGDEVEAAGYEVIARGAVAPEDCDVFGRMRPEMLPARLSEGLTHLTVPLREAARREVGPAVRVGGAALEMRLSYFDLPRSGALVELRSAIVEVKPKSARFRHWLVDPLTGAAWAAGEQVSINFDLDARKAIALSEESVERLKPFVRGL